MTDVMKITVCWESVAVNDNPEGVIAQMGRLFSEAEARLKWAPSASENTLLLRNGFHVQVAEGFGLNTVNPETAEGGGMLDDVSGEQRDLLLIMLFMRASMPANQFLLCDEEGGVLSPSSWQETTELLKKLGVEVTDEVLEKALALNLRPAPIEFGVSEDIEDAWF